MILRAGDQDDKLVGEVDPVNEDNMVDLVHQRRERP